MHSPPRQQMRPLHGQLTTSGDAAPSSTVHKIHILPISSQRIFLAAALGSKSTDCFTKLSFGGREQRRQTKHMEYGICRWGPSEGACTYDTIVSLSAGLELF